ncbi:NB-ARC domain-containing protein [Pleurocapsa sp. PCC 7327]|uniref:DUF1822 family protein n=1 Tax=Pleurocapsa sp. PCC 7327 TaxID=118163 RepID=UPI0002A00067|nr:DUF1822 family protein [Pleurocapsa sp. PCC 7327]AFY77697.1 NB-ARC domain-containing protein [Pleurocapsa sp. PCC 7327]
MNFEETLNFVDAIVFQQAGRHLSAPEVIILEGTWQGMTYDQMAENSQYSLNYLMRDIGPRLWRMLSGVLGEEVSKTNFRVILERRLFSLPVKTTLSQLIQENPNEKNIGSISYEELDGHVTSEIATCHNWNETPERSVFFGRTEELATLKQWIQDGCNLIAIRGISGIGKTALARQLAEEIREQFDCTLWCSLSQAPRLKELLASLQKAFSGAQSEYEDDSLSSLMGYLRSSRCLLVLDGVEAILQPNQLAGRYREGYENYGELFARVGEESHQSCLLVTSLENPREIGLLEGESAPVRSLILSGLSISDAGEILQAEGLSDSSSWRSLVERYQGNPAALKLAAKLICDLFNGNVAEFLEREIFVFGDIGKLLAPLRRRLSELEREVLYWLAIERRPISFSSLATNLSLPISQGELLEALASLGQRSLLEKTTTSEAGKSLFALPPMVMEYVTSQLVEQISGKVSHRLKLSSAFEDTIELTPSPKQPTNLSQWFDYAFEEAWQPVEVLIANPRILPRLRSIYHLRGEDTTKRFKAIRLPESQKQVALLVAIAQDCDQKIGIRIQLQPMGEETVLPDNLTLALLNESGQILREVRSQNQDNFIQLPRFRGEAQKRFSIRIAHNTFSIKEDFVI